MAIDVGSEAINRASGLTSGYTVILVDNPANASGTLTDVDIWAASNLTGTKVGTFFNVSGNTYQCRDSEDIGAVTAGSKQTFSGLSISVQTGDYIGMYWTGGTMERDTSGSAGYYWSAGDHADPSDQTAYTLSAGYTLSLYGYSSGSSTTTTTETTSSSTSSSSSSTSSTATASTTSSTTSTTSSTASTASTTSSTSSTASTSSTSSTASTTSSTSSTASTTSTSSTTSSTSSSTTSTTSSTSSSSTSTTTTYASEVSLECDSGIYDLTSQQTVFSYTNTASETLVCQLIAYLGDGVNDLDGSGGEFELTLVFGSRNVQPDPQLITFSTDTQASIFTEQFPLPQATTVEAKIKSPNAADTSVYVKVCIFEVGVESIRDDLRTLIVQRRNVTYVTDESGGASGVYPTRTGGGTGVYPSRC